MKNSISLVAGLVIALSASMTSANVEAAEGDTKVGQPVCTAAGCYQMVCNVSGCSLVFTPSDPFKKTTQENL